MSKLPSHSLKKVLEEYSNSNGNTEAFAEMSKRAQLLTSQLDIDVWHDKFNELLFSFISIFVNLFSHKDTHFSLIDVTKDGIDIDFISSTICPLTYLIEFGKSTNISKCG